MSEYEYDSAASEYESESATTGEGSKDTMSSSKGTKRKTKGNGNGKSSSGRGKSGRVPRRLDPSAQIGDHHGDEDSCSRYFKAMQTCGGLFVSCMCFPIAICGCGPVREVKEGMRGAMLTFGKLSRVLSPGLYHFNPCTQSIIVLPVSVQSINVPQQTVLTLDNLSVGIDAICFVRVIDVGRAAFSVRDYKSAVVNLAATTLAAIVGETSSDELFQSRDDLNDRIRDSIQPQTDAWGILIEGVEISDVSIPVHMQRILAATVEAKREGDAKLITAKAELRAAKTLAKAAAELDNPAALSLRYWQVLSEISVENSSTVIVPSNAPDMAAAVAGAASRSRG